MLKVYMMIRLKVTYTIANTAGTINGKTLMEGLPLVGTEDFELTIEDANGNKIEIEI